MHSPVVLVSDPIPQGALALLHTHCAVRHVDGRDRRALLAAVADAAALVVRSGTTVDREVLEQAPALRVVARAGVGLDNIDTEAARARGVTVVNTPGANTVSVAELTVGLAVASMRHVFPAAQSLRQGEWRRADFTGTELFGRTAGILGLGRVGRQVARRLGAFGMEIVAHDPYATVSVAEDAGARLVGFDELLRSSDLLTIHLPRTAETAGLIGERELGLVKPSLHLINTARGGIVDEDALARALKDGRLAAAALDVFATEPPGVSPLLALPNVLAIPHLGASTDDAQQRAGTDAARAVLDALGARAAIPATA